MPNHPQQQAKAELFPNGDTLNLYAKPYATAKKGKVHQCKPVEMLSFLSAQCPDEPDCD